MLSSHLPLTIVVVFASLAVVTSFITIRQQIANTGRAQLPRLSASQALKMSVDETGKLLCTGLTDGNMATENFLLELLHQQKKWNPINAALTDIQSKKLFMTRNARYTGVLDVLKFQEDDDLKNQVAEADAWVAMNVQKEQLKEYAQMAKDSSLKRLVIVSAFPRKEGTSPEVEAASSILKDSDVDYTLIRIDGVVPGDEGGQYMVLNMTQASAVEGEDFASPIKRGNLARVVSEALTLKSANNKEVAAVGPDEMGKAFLEHHRATGTNRRLEVNRFFNGHFGFIYSELSKIDAKKAETAEVKAAEEEEQGEMQAQDNPTGEKPDIDRAAEMFKDSWEEMKTGREKRLKFVAGGIALDPHRILHKENMTNMGDEEFLEVFRVLPKVQETANEILDFIDESYFMFHMTQLFPNMTLGEFEGKYGKLAWHPENVEELMEQEWSDKELGAYIRERRYPVHEHFPQIVTKDQIYAFIKEAIEADPDMAQSDDPSSYFAFRDYMDATGGDY